MGMEEGDVPIYIDMLYVVVRAQNTAKNTKEKASNV